MAKKTGLGRGLEALIPGGENVETGGVSNIPVHLITPNPRQPRSHIDPTELSELSASIREHGIIQPLIVSYDKQAGIYCLIAGERRLIAARQAGLETIPAIIREINDQQRIELALVENLQRADLNPLEAAEAYRQLAEDFHLSHEEISTRVGKSRVTVTNTLRLLKLPDSVKQSLVQNHITEGHARALLSLPTSQAQSSALQTILTHELSVRQTEELVRKLIGEKPPIKEKLSRLPEIIELEERLRIRLGTKVLLNQRQKGGGTITIHYYSNEELDALVNQIMGKPAS